MSDFHPPLKPLQHHIDKSSTQPDKFLKKFPEFDGRGIKIAVIDGSLDISLPGLQQTTTGLPKIIDCYDFTGNGNVDTSTVKYTLKNDVLIGLTGRILKIPSTWKNPSGKWHLGIKPMNELFDEEAIGLITKTRKNHISEKNTILKAEKLESFSGGEEDHNSMLEYLDATEKLSEDPLVADCIVWFNGEEWEACIDTSFNGSLDESKTLTNFRDSHDHGLIFDKIAYCITIHEDGNMLEIYVPFGNHTTLIANIAAAHFPDDAEKNGMAPGAQIYSMSVLNHKNGDYGYKKGFIKAFEKCLEVGVDIINFSITTFPEEVYPIMKELTEKHGTLIIKSAGNNGPIHSSVPDLEPWVNDMIFHIGSMISSDTKNILRETDERNSATTISVFSSCGPMASGSAGVTFIAPGHGISANPRHFLDQQYSFGATSFSAPNAVGAIACLISGLKKKNIPYSPYTLKLALSNTALSIGEGNPLAYGNGIIQIDNAFEYFQIRNLQTISIKNITFLLNNASEFFNEKNVKISGIFLKLQSEKEFSDVYKFSVKIVVKEATDLSWSLRISQDAENFVSISETVENDTFLIQINTNLLKFDSINYGEIHGFDSSNLSLGPLFKFPITVIVPKFINKNEEIKNVISLNSSKIHRLLFCPPPESRQCIMRISCLEENASETLQFYYFDGCDEIEFSPELKQRSGCFLIKNDIYCWDTLEQLFGRVREDRCYEICFYSKSNNCKKFKYELQFIGIEKINSFNYLNPFRIFSKSRCVWFRNSDLNAVTTTSTLIEFDRIKFELTAEKVEYKRMNEKCYFVLTYSFKVSNNNTKYKIKIKYNGKKFLRPYEVERVQILTESKKFIASFCECSKEIILNPGNYVVKALFEYDDTQLLQKIFPFAIRFHVLLVKEYFRESVKPNLQLQNSGNDFNKKIEEGETFQIYYNSISNNIKLSTSSLNMPIFTTLKGSVKMEIEKKNFYFKMELNYCNLWNGFTVFEIIKEFVQSFLPYSSEIAKTLGIISPKELFEWQKKLKTIYFEENQERIMLETVEAFLQAVNYKCFFIVYDKIKVDGNVNEKRLLETRKDAIIDGLFMRADAMLNQCLKMNSDIPKIFCDISGGYKLLSFKNIQPESPKCNNFFTNLLGYYIRFPVLLVKDYFPTQNEATREFSFNHSKNEEILKSDIPENQLVRQNCKITETIKAVEKENAKNACQDFLQRASNSDIRRDLIIIKKAILFGNFGTALLYLNKLSKENFSNPKFKIVDEAIIDILKHFGWKHLAEAHQNSMLDKHRSYYRFF